MARAAAVNPSALSAAFSATSYAAAGGSGPALALFHPFPSPGVAPVRAAVRAVVRAR